MLAWHLEDEERGSHILVFCIHTRRHSQVTILHMPPNRSGISSKGYFPGLSEIFRALFSKFMNYCCKAILVYLLAVVET
jgi:hypothetical protein